MNVDSETIVPEAYESDQIGISESKEILSELMNKYPDNWKEVVDFLDILRDLGLETYKLSAPVESPIVVQFSIN